METDVVVVGGGVTGVAVLRDLALRGVHAVLVERFDLGTGTSGRWHGLLHSGARYAVRDQESMPPSGTAKASLTSGASSGSRRWAAAADSSSVGMPEARQPSTNFSA